jgi:hypothetical protein
MLNALLKGVLGPSHRTSEFWMVFWVRQNNAQTRQTKSPRSSRVVPQFTLASSECLIEPYGFVIRTWQNQFEKLLLCYLALQ